MSDPLRVEEGPLAAEVLARSLHGPDWDGLTDAFTVEDQVAALLATNPGQPVVITQDRRLRPEGWDWVRCPHSDDHSMTGNLCDICGLPRPSSPGSRPAEPEEERVALPTQAEVDFINGLSPEALDDAINPNL